MATVTMSSHGPGDVLTNGRLRDEYYAHIPPDHFAPKSGDQILEIGIIGAGIAGLAAASALVQSGHNVDVYERSKFANEIGAAINMCPNACRVLSFLEFNFERPKPTTTEVVRFVNGGTLDLLRSADTPDFSQMFGHPWLLYHRVDVHNELKRTATEPRPHTSKVAHINLLSEVSEIDLDGKIVFKDGRELKKDVIIVADGVRSRFASRVVGTETKVLPSGTMAYRFLIPTEKLLSDPRTRPIYDLEKSTMQLAPTTKGERLVWYPCRGGELQNYGFFLPDKIEGYEEEVWNVPASREAFLKATVNLHPDLQAVCEKAEDLKLWRLCSYPEPLPTLVRDRVVLIGDAAHPMLPHQGQGGGMAIEDGAALGVLLSQMKSKDEIPDRLRLFQELRLKRVSAMVILSSVGQDQYMKIADRARPYVDGRPPQSTEEYHEFNFTPNVVRDAMELLARHQAES